MTIKSKLKAFVKSSHVVYNLYYFCLSSFLRMVGIFITVDPNMVLFVSYGGQKYDDSPRFVYEFLRDHSGFDKLKLIWAFVEPGKYKEPLAKIEIDTFKYYITAMKAGYWITNSSAARGLNFKKKATKNILFQHGMAGIKKIGVDIQEKQGTYHQGYNESFDMIFVEGKKEIDILAHAWNCNKDIIYQTGLPRNDDLIGFSKKDVLDIKRKLGIPNDKKVILYAPTFRELNRSNDYRNTLSIPFEFSKLEKVLGDEYVILITAHYEVAVLLNELPKNSFVYNAFKYPVLNDLLKVADILISDYSSVIFDYSILERPIFCYGYDYDSYRKERGFYTDLEKLYSHGVLKNQIEVEEAILNIDYEKECQYTKKHIKDEYLAAYGNSAEKAVRIIFPELCS